jgi:hypothetical protein
MMFMNAKDAQGFAEDAAILEANRPSSTISAADLYVAAAALRTKNKAIQVRDTALAETKAKFVEINAGYSDLSAVVLAQRGVIDALADQLATKMGLDAADVRKAAYKGISDRYDAKVSEMLATGVLAKDPRKDPEVLARPTRDWYTPEG